MARRERTFSGRTVAAPWLASMVAACLPLTWSAAAAADTYEDEPLEPAKAAMRVRDYATAIRLLTADADRGDAQARYLLGSLQFAGLGTPMDRNQARTLFEASARAGHARAAYALAAVLAQDSPDERAAALHWLERAAQLGDGRAREAWQRRDLPLDFDPERDLPDETSRREAMVQAAARNDRSTLEALLDSTRIHATDAFGRTALHRAAESGALASIELLLVRGAAVDSVDQYGITPLMLACAAEPAAACRRLLDAGADVAVADRVGHTAVWYAARHARTEQERSLLAAGAKPVPKPNPVTTTSFNAGRLPRAGIDAYAGWPDVAVAATRRDPTALQAILAAGADPDARSAHGDTPLHSAVAANSPQAIAVLLQAGADPLLADAQGVTPLGRAVRLGHRNAVEALLDRGVPPSARTPGQALMIAAARGQPDMLQILLAAGADPSAADANGRPAITIAACRGDLAGVEALLRAGAAVNGADRTGVSALACAAARGHPGIVDRLLGAGAQVSAPTHDGNTPLMLASAGGHAAVVRRLIIARADANAQNRRGDTALILASQAGNVEVVSALLGAGARRQLRNREGVAAIDVARSHGIDAVAALLR